MATIQSMMNCSRREKLVQRLRALNAFINAIYNDRKILKNKVVPEELLKTSKNYRAICEGMKPVHGV